MTAEPHELLKLYNDGCKGAADIDMGELLWDILRDVQSSYNLAMVDREDIPAEAIIDVERTVTDYLVNHYGDET